MTAGRVLPSEELLGTLTTGAPADFVVLDRDPSSIPPEELSEVQALSTWFGGRCVAGSQCPGR